MNEITLNWSEEKPTTTGLYLYREHGYFPIHLKRVDFGNWEVAQNPEWLYFGIEPIKNIRAGLWAGPLQEPPKL